MFERLHVSRRSLLRALILAGAATPALLTVMASSRAMSRRPIVPGVQEFAGDFRLNGGPARVGQVVNPGDIAVTGPNSSAIIIVGEHAFMLRADTTIEFYPVHFEKDGAVSGVLKIATGAILSVFGKTDSTSIQTPLALIGIRGTGCYVDTRPERTYACVCYGRADLSSAATGVLLQSVTTTRHDQPRFIYPPGAPMPIATAPVIDHGDAELRLLEAVVYRTPPFDVDGEPIEDRY